MLLSYTANTDKEGMERNETVKAGSSDHRVPKKRANVIYSK